MPVARPAPAQIAASAAAAAPTTVTMFVRLVRTARCECVVKEGAVLLVQGFGIAIQILQLMGGDSLYFSGQ